MAATAERRDSGTEAAAPARGGIQSLERAAALLDAVAASGPAGIGLADLSERVGLHTSTAFHLVKTLESLGFLTRRGDSKRYRIGSRLFVLAAGALDESALLTLGTPILERLSQTTGEAAHLAVRSNAEIVIVARTAAAGMLQLSERSGVVRPAHATAIGKMLLAECSDADLDRLLAGLEMPAFTPNTLTDPTRLRAEIAAIRAEGVAHDRQELDLEVRCIAVPVRDFAGRCVAAMGLSAPVWRLEPARLEALIGDLRQAADGLSAALGGARP